MRQDYQIVKDGSVFRVLNLKTIRLSKPHFTSEANAENYIGALIDWRIRCQKAS